MCFEMSIVESVGSLSANFKHSIVESVDSFVISFECTFEIA